MSQPQRSQRSLKRLALTNGIVSLILGAILIAKVNTESSTSKWLIVIGVVLMTWGLGIWFDYKRLQR